MPRSLSFKFLLLLFGVAAVALSGTVIVRGLMLRDFREYLEGDQEDRVYGVTAGLESAYERDGGWDADAEARNAVWALTLGFEMRLLDRGGAPVIDTKAALEKSPLPVRRRLEALSQSWGPPSGAFVPYPLFLLGKRIGTVELRALRPVKEALYIERADSFLVIVVLVVGVLAVLLSVLFSRRLTRPIKELSLAATDIRQGRLKRRVETSRRDEVGSLTNAFNRMAADLERQETLRRKLLADVAHELRTPLGVMRGELEGMMDGVIPVDERRFQSLHEETGRLKGMVEGIEDLNQAEAGALSLNKKHFEIGPFLGNIVERFKAPFGEKGVGLELSCGEGTRVFADPDRLSQVVLNLLSNALKATDKGCLVRVSAACDKGEAQVTVEDNGKGIREEDLPLLFERFYHGPGGGLGIGLTIAKELVEAHGGRIVARSGRNGRGAAFVFSLPLSGVHNCS